MLTSQLCDYSDAYCCKKKDKGTNDVRGTNDANRIDNKVTFKNNALFRSCISELNGTFIENREDLDIVMPIYNLLEYLLDK